MLRTNACFLAGAIGLLAMPVMADQILLRSGDRLSGTITRQDESHVVLRHDTLGDLTIPRAEIIGDPGIVPVPDVAEPQLLMTATDDGEWDNHFTVGLGSSFGNSDNQNVSGGIDSRRETDTDRTLLDAWYYYGASDGERNENRFTAGILHDWLWPDSRWLLFASGRYDNDEFQSWDHRLAGHLGVGYRLYDTEDFDLTLRAGLGASKEWGSEDEDIKPELLLGFDLGWDIDERSRFEAGSTFYMDLEDMPEFRSLSYARWTMDLDDESNLALHAGVEHEYQSKVDGDTDPSDWRVVAGLGFDF